ncbi:EamA family transporter RarD [Actibacterium sp. 188UL27-1]|uniref:EamA family transporter RarD n=1 Tax=Actibacterium sp. 188UL27-1 TaxID=2786961 RepID=UPI00195ADF11|nr:EamA family transporter RarD [Actibacterium sp. 188UL27-1]MBM7066879.1 EamA family transporter RarD [Actibacterium sp. 188UL27-1]
MTRPAVQGLLAMVGACLIWGLSPLYYKLLDHVPATEVLAHRTLWSGVFFAAVLLIQRRLREVPNLLRHGAGLIVLAAVMISVNWFLFIWSVQVGRTIEASLGYYIFPLVAVVLGAGAFGERLGRVQWIAVGLAAAAVLTLILGLAVVPVISLALAITFGIYGLLKKRLSAGPVVSVTAEVAVLLPLAMAWLAVLHGQGGGVFGRSVQDTGVLMLSGVLTAGPLILFSYATRRVQMATIGLVQYLNPTLQFGCAVVVFQEPFTRWHALAFAMIWIALAIYSGQAIWSGRKASSNAATVGTTRA